MNKQIIKNREIEDMDGLHKTHFLNNNAVRINKSLGDIAGLKNIGFHIIEVSPGNESTEYHFHHYEDECTYILSGKAAVTIGEQEYEVSTGDFIGYPAGGEAHTMKNIGTEPLVCIVAGQRLQQDIVDYPALNKRLYCYNGTNDLVDIPDITASNVGKKA